MKKILIITGLLFCLFSYAQHNYDNQNVIYSHSEDKVSIGSNELFGVYGANTSALEIYKSGNNSAYLQTKTNNGNVSIGGSDDFGNGITFSNNLPFSFFMHGGIGGVMRFQTNGNVSIGTGNSATGYKLSVGGKIMAEELKVQLEGDWPDFVFEPNYSLSSLSMLERFINKNKHLPNIPSAQEVRENGIEVGEMSAKLLQKIEELTLYVIDLHKETEKLKKELLLLKKNNNLN